MQALDAEAYNRQWAGLDDYCKHNPGSLHRYRLISQTIRKLHFKTLLDAGCGNGGLLTVLRRVPPEAAVHFSGADLSDDAVAKNRKVFPGMDFHVLDIEKGALPQTFDLIINSEVLEHLNDRRVAFSNLVKMLNPGGHLLVTCPTGRVFETERYFGHTTHPTAEEILGYAKENQLEVVRNLNRGFPVYRLTKWLINVNSNWALKNFASGSYSPAGKALAKITYTANYLNIPSSPWGCELFFLFKK